MKSIFCFLRLMKMPLNMNTTISVTFLQSILVTCYGVCRGSDYFPFKTGSVSAYLADSSSTSIPTDSVPTSGPQRHDLNTTSSQCHNQSTRICGIIQSVRPCPCPCRQSSNKTPRGQGRERNVPPNLQYQISHNQAHPERSQ